MIDCEVQSSDTRRKAKADVPIRVKRSKEIRSMLCISVYPAMSDGEIVQGRAKVGGENRSLKR